MSATDRHVDTGVALVVALSTVLLLDAPPAVRLACTVLAAAAGMSWRRPLVTVAAASAAIVLPLVTAGEDYSQEWDVPLVLLAVISLGAFGSMPVALAGLAVLSTVVWWGEAFRAEDGAGIALTLAAVAALARGVTAAARRAVAARRRADELAATSPADAARRAVTEERRRLAADVEQALRSAVTVIATLAREARVADDGGRAGLRAIQEHGQQAVVELRRLLGLLRQPLEPPAVTTEPTVPAGSDRRRTVGFAADVGLAGTFGALSFVELRLFGGPGGGPLTAGSTEAPWAYLATTAAAATVLTWRRAPRIGAAMLGGIFLVGAATGVPVSPGGASVLLAITLFTWQCIALRCWTAAAALGALLVGILASSLTPNPDDVWYVLVVAAAVAVPAYVTTRRTVVAETAIEESSRLEAEHDVAAREAVRGERLVVARELHDVVSHAVVVMVVQAGAAEAVVHTDHAAVLHALDTISATAATAATELDRLFELIDGTAVPPATTVVRDGRQLRALIERMRAGGLTIDLIMTAPDDDPVEPVVYRVVQEALTNVLRHVGPTHVRVTVDAGPAATAVEVLDDGSGRTTAAPRGYGLTGISERVRQLGGTVETGPRPGGSGFRVAARVPAPTRPRP